MCAACCSGTLLASTTVKGAAFRQLITSSLQRILRYNSDTGTSATSATGVHSGSYSYGMGDAVIDVEDLHRTACQNRSNTYKDPVTGFTCFTELAHLKRGVCCGSLCRHCPYGWENVGRSNNQHRVAKVKSGDRAAISALLQTMKEEQYTTISDDTSCSTGTNTGSSDCDSFSDSAPQKQSPAADRNETSAFHQRNDSDTNHSETQPIAKSKSVKTGGRHGGRSTSKNVPYTRGGDQGTTALLTGERRSKADAAFEAMGTVDELCSVTGVCYASVQELLLQQNSSEQSSRSDSSGATEATTTSTAAARQVVGLHQMNEWLLDIMSRLFDIGSHVAKPPRRHSQRRTVDGVNDSDDDSEKEPPVTFEADGVGGGFHESHVTELEDWIDLLTEELPELLSFVLPTGHVAAAQLHVARTVCRRVERILVSLVVEEHVCDPNALRYMNRLSDFFFTAARYVNYQHGVAEILYRRPVRGATQRQRQVDTTALSDRPL